MAKRKRNRQWFVITKMHRDDLAIAGYDGSNVSDDTMTDLAYKMESAYVSNCYWLDLEILAEELNIPKLPEE